jgi:hypothetical protein
VPVSRHRAHTPPQDFTPTPEALELAKQRRKGRIADEYADRVGLLIILGCGGGGGVSIGSGPDGARVWHWEECRCLQLRIPPLPLRPADPLPPPQIEITDAPPVVPIKRTDDDRLEALAAPDRARLKTNRAAYTAFKMVG